MTWPVPPAVPIWPMIASTMSLAVTPSGSVPSTRTSMFFAGFCSSVCVASTCSTSDVPMPNASAPIAPCVEVWLSPQTMVMPGRLMPCSGPMMWTMPWRVIEQREIRHAELGDVALQRLDLDAAFLLLDAGARGRVVGDVVVGHRDGRVRAAHLAAGQPQALEGLRAGHLVDEVAVDVEDAGAVRQPLDDMAVPDLVEQRARLASRT